MATDESRWFLASIRTATRAQTQRAQLESFVSFRETTIHCFFKYQKPPPISQTNQIPMKSNPQNRFQSAIRLLAVICLGCAGVSTSRGADKTWVDAAANNTWDTSATDTWADATAWNNATPDSAIFSGSGETVTLGEPITAASVTFGTAGYMLSGEMLTLAGAPSTITATTNAEISSVLAGTAGLTKLGGGTLTLSNEANSYTGSTFINGGTLTTATGIANVQDLAIGATLILNGGTTYASKGDGIAGILKSMPLRPSATPPPTFSTGQTRGSGSTAAPSPTVRRPIPSSTFQQAPPPLIPASSSPAGPWTVKTASIPA